MALPAAMMALNLMEGAVDSEVGTLSAPSLGTPLLLPRSVRRSSRRRRAPIPKQSLPERLSALSAAQYELLERTILDHTPVPPWHSRSELATRFRKLDEEPFARELKRRIDCDTLALADRWNSEPDVTQQTKTLRIPNSLNDEVSIITRRLLAIREQRTRQLRWAFSCLLSGDLSPEVPGSLASAHLWEQLEVQAIIDLVMSPAKEATRNSPSRHAFDQTLRNMRARVRELGQAGDDIQIRRERLLVAIDLWNSTSADLVYTAKAWRADALTDAVLSPLLASLREATTSVSAGLITRFGHEQVRRLVSFRPEDQPFLRTVFDTLVEGAEA